MAKKALALCAFLLIAQSVAADLLAAAVDSMSCKEIAAIEKRSGSEIKEFDFGEEEVHVERKIEKGLLIISYECVDDYLFKKQLMFVFEERAVAFDMFEGEYAFLLSKHGQPTMSIDNDGYSHSTGPHFWQTNEGRLSLSFDGFGPGPNSWVVTIRTF